MNDVVLCTKYTYYYDMLIYL